MNTLSTVLLFLLALIVMPSLLAQPMPRSTDAQAAAVVASTTSTRSDQSESSGTASADVTASAVKSSTSSVTRPANKERSRRPARIDMTMPYYRFGRLPTRIKD